MKYILVDVSQDLGVTRRIPLLFPDFVEHYQMALAAEHLGIPGTTLIVGAGMTDSELSMVYGGSESLGITAQQSDLSAIRYADSTSCIHDPVMYANLSVLDAERGLGRSQASLDSLEESMQLLLSKSDDIAKNIVALQSAATTASVQTQPACRSCTDICSPRCSEMQKEEEEHIKKSATTMELSTVTHKEKFVPQHKEKFVPLQKQRPRGKLI